MDAVLLAGGKGTRLRPLTVARPKPLVPIANRPIMGYQLDLLERGGFDRIFIPVDYLGERIVEYIEGLSTGMDFEFTHGNLSRGTAGAVGNLRDHLSDTFLVISGDLLVNVDLAELVKFHNGNGSSATIVLTSVEDPTHYGIARLEDDRIIEFVEKPDPSNVFSNLINAGIYVFEPEILEHIPGDVEYDFSMDLFPRVLDDYVVSGYRLSGYWNDVGRPSRYLQANGDALSGRFPLGEFNERYRTLTEMEPVKGENSRIADGNISCPVLMGDGCVVEEGCVFRSFVVLGDQVRVGRGSVLDGVVVHDDVSIGENGKMVKSIIGRGTEISSDVELAEGTVIGDQTRMGAGCRIGANMKIWSGSTLGPNTIIVPD